MLLVLGTLFTPNPEIHTRLTHIFHLWATFLSSLFAFSLFLRSLYWFAYLGVVQVCHSARGGQRAVHRKFSPPTCRFQGFNTACQAWWQMPFILIVLTFQFAVYFVCMRVGPRWEIRRYLWTLVLFFHHVGLENKTPVLMLGKSSWAILFAPCFFFFFLFLIT